MARNTNNGNGQDHGAGESGGSQSGLMVIQLAGESRLNLPEGDYLSKGDIVRDGQDLILRGSDGTEIVIEGYFSASPMPVLMTESGSALTPELVESFVKSDSLQYAEAGSATSDESPIGAVKEMSGKATVTRADGTVETVAIGTPIFQGDIVETEGDGAVNIVFIDESSFAVSENARLAIDEYVFDPASQSGETNFSILRGVFVFTSGLIGRDDPDDVEINTPVGSIGIRGTTIAGTIDPDGESQITVIEGAIVIKNGAGEVTLSEQYETVSLNGYDSEIASQGQIDAQDVASAYGAVQSVSPSFFSTLNDNAADDAADAPADTGLDADAAPADNAPADGNNAAPAADDAAPAPDQTGFDAPAAEDGAAADAPIPTFDMADSFSAGFDASADYNRPASFGDDGSAFGNDFAGDGAFNFMPPPPPPPGADSGMFPPPGDGADGFGANGTVGDFNNAPPPPPLDIVFNDIHMDDDMTVGAIVARVQTTVGYNFVQFTLDNVPTNGGGTPYFFLDSGVNDHVAVVRLSAAGRAALVAEEIDVGDVFGMTVRAELPDGRVTFGYLNFSVADASFAEPSTLLSESALVLTGAAGQGLGATVAFAGFIDGDPQGDYMIGSKSNPTIIVRELGGVVGSHNYSSVISNTTGLNVSGVGDFNADGNVDFVVGAPQSANADPEDGGQFMVVNGSNMADFTQVNSGTVGDEKIGQSVAGIGDYNGDGYNDVIIGAPGTNGGNGALHLMLGVSGTISSNIDMSSLANVQGTTNQHLGNSVSSAGDYNNDGFADLIVSRMDGTTIGAAVIHTGGAAGTLGTTITFTNIAVDSTDPSVPLVNLGDINGDGKSDVMIGSNAGTGKAHVVFGGNTGGDINTMDNVTILPESGGTEMIGGGAAGDFNGDGFNDMVIATRDGSLVDVFVIYGSLGINGTINLDAGFNMGRMYTLNLNGRISDPENGAFHINFASGDSNGDGFDDLVIGTEDDQFGNGSVMFLNGRASDTNLNNLVATGADKELNGTTGTDVMSDSGIVGTSFRAGAGNDTLNLSNNSPNVIDGGSGYDTVNVMSGGLLDFSVMGQDDLSGIEKFVFSGATQTLKLGLDDIFRLLQESHDGTLRIKAGASSIFQIENNGLGNTGGINAEIDSLGFTETDNAFNGGDGSTYTVYEFGASGAYNLLIDNAITSQTIV